MVKRKCFKCGTELDKNAVYCPECGVNIQEYFNQNKNTLIMGKQPKDNMVIEPEPKIGKFTALCLLGCIFIPLIGWIILIFYLWTFNNRKKEWREKQMINELQKINKKAI